MFFYHASPKGSLKSGNKIKLTKLWNNKIHYACLASTPSQAYYWACILGYSRKVYEWEIWQVEVPGDDTVYNCVGKYFFETQPKFTKAKAKEVLPHMDPDGEIAVVKEYAVKEVFSKLQFNFDSIL